MAKKKVKFKLTDGIMPKKTEIEGSPFELRLPLDVNLPANSEVTVKLGVSCATPALIVKNGTVKLCAPGEEFSVVMKSSGDPTSFGRGEVVAHAFVIDNTDMVVE